MRVLRGPSSIDTTPRCTTLHRGPSSKGDTSPYLRLPAQPQRGGPWGPRGPRGARIDSNSSTQPPLVHSVVPSIRLPRGCCAQTRVTIIASCGVNSRPYTSDPGLSRSGSSCGGGVCPFSQPGGRRTTPFFLLPSPLNSSHCPGVDALQRRFRPKPPRRQVLRGVLRISRCHVSSQIVTMLNHIIWIVRVH